MGDYIKKLFLITNCIARCVAFVCITGAAIYFGKGAILFWYIVPLLMSPCVEEEDTDDE